MSMFRLKSELTIDFSENDTVTVGDSAYTFKATPAAADDVDIGTDTTASAINLLRAINEGTNGGSYYTDTTINVDCYATRSALILTIPARTYGAEGDDLALSTTAANITASAAYLSGGLREYDALVQLDVWMTTISLLGGQINSKIGGGGNAGLAKDIKESIADAIASLPISGALVDTDGTTRAPLSNVPVTNADTYPIADMSDPTNWGHDADRDFDRD